MPKFILSYSFPDNSLHSCNQNETTSLIAESFPSLSIQMLFDMLDSSELSQFARRGNIHGYFKQLRTILCQINNLLNDAENKQMAMESAKIWLGELQNLAYDVQDMLDAFETEVLRSRLLLEPADHQPSISKFRKLIIPTCCTNFTTRSIMFDSEVISKMKEVTTRLQQIARKTDQLGLGTRLEGRTTEVNRRQESKFLEDEVRVYGRETDKEQIVKLLLRDDLRADDGFSVISIVGMGGVGKTTLAQLIYNDDRLQGYFDFRAWTTVSQDFDVTRMTKAILRYISFEAVNANDLNLLQGKLKTRLTGKKFLLVLDDLWNQNYNDWTNLSLPFEAGAAGSKIIVTTRNQNVALMMGAVSTYQLGVLSMDDCLRIFAHHALGRGDFRMHPHLQEIGEKIVIKCDGLPLAAVTIGSLLRGKVDLRDWENVLINKIWDLSEERYDDILPTLRLSYHYLSPYLKQCFVFCSLFPVGYEFQEEEIILLWMAEGFLHLENSEKQMEDLGLKYYQELCSMSFFQPSSTDGRFVMHDLIHVLAQWAAGDVYFRMEGILEDEEQQKFSKDLRHLSYIHGEYGGIRKFDISNDIKHLRTFLPIMSSTAWRDNDDWACSVLEMLLKQARLRVLSVRGYHIFELPHSIGGLKQLRYLNLSETRIKRLPESVGSLYNLQTLKVEDCRRLESLCTEMGNLVKLHHLGNRGSDSLEKMPLGIGKLTSLQTLHNFVLGKDACSGLRELKSLIHLRGRLKISKLENVRDAGDAKEAEINVKGNLQSLLLEWSSNADNSREPETATKVLDMLQPHRNLMEFTLSGYAGTRFPTWLGDSSFSNLELLRFQGCCSCTCIPSVGKLPSLKHLFISGMASVKCVGSEIYGDGCSVLFQSLETLSFEDMQEWEMWIAHGDGQEVVGFPRLRELSLVRCPKLIGKLPEYIPSLERLVIRSCNQLLEHIPSLPTFCKLEVGE